MTTLQEKVKDYKIPQSMNWYDLIQQRVYASTRHQTLSSPDEKARMDRDYWMLGAVRNSGCRPTHLLKFGTREFFMRWKARQWD
jgi:hypothetical protein